MLVAIALWALMLGIVAIYFVGFRVLEFWVLFAFC